MPAPRSAAADERSRQDPSRPLTGIAERLAAAGDGDRQAEGRTDLGTLLQAAAGNAFGPLLLVPAVLAWLPVIGAIPGMSILTGALLALIAGQVLLGRRHPWVPARLKRIGIGRQALTRGIDAAKPWLAALDRLVSRRLSWMTRGSGRHLAMLCILGMAALMFPLAVVPFGVMLPATAILAIALGVTAGDGAWVIAGCFASAAAAGASALLLAWI